MQEMESYKLWCGAQLEDSDLSAELAAIDGDTDAIKDRFYKDLEFGTGGLRGVIGAGTNRMNIYTVRRATQGLANYLNEQGDSPSCAISYDSRIKSDIFAREAARVLAANGIKAYLYSRLMPTPCLSFAVRELHCDAGIMITASHNPAKYNGYKAYGPDGCQLTLDAANRVLSLIEQIDIFQGINLIGFEQAVSEGSIEYIPDDMEEKYLACVMEQSLDREAVSKANLKVVYTPLNGTGNLPVRKILEMSGMKDVVVVPEQEKPDGTFRTCPYPNPEIAEALELGLKLSKKEQPDLLLATDPDCDRMGIAVPNDNGEYVLISGNEAGVLLLDYICRMRTKNHTMPEAPIAVKTIVTTPLAARIAADYGVQMIDVLTGFKFIGEQILLLEKQGGENRYIFGFEESYGYLAGTYVRDKDAVVASMLICEMAAHYKLQGISVLEALSRLYDKYGVYLNRQESFTCEGVSGMERMREIMDDLRENPPPSVAGKNVVSISDYLASETKDCTNGKKTPIRLPKSDVIAFTLENGAAVLVRPSGTEPKIKVYYMVSDTFRLGAEAFLETLKADFTRIIGF